MKRIMLGLLMVGTISGLGGCAATNQTKGVGIGAVTGGVLGGVIGHQSGHKKEGALLGAAVGAALGAVVGQRMDEQAKELEQVPGVGKVDVNKEEGNQQISAQMKVLFDKDRTEIKPSESNKLDKLAEVFAKYPENVVTIEGHTDTDGTEQYNQKLSQQRAEKIQEYLSSKNLNIAQLKSVGYGEDKPLFAPDDTEEKKAENRRVEIKISFDPNRIPQEAMQPASVPENTQSSPY